MSFASEPHVPLKSDTAWGGITQRLYEMVLHRKANPSSDSYVSTLLQGDEDRILKKVIEEAGEVVLAGKNSNREEIIYETADLWFHSLVMLGQHSISPEEIYQELGKRFGKTGIRTVEGEASRG
jgi:phosphoribosyl-ATP pyrophosphohydrolase/phosphoribosyl-AMP cyclohydrolase